MCELKKPEKEALIFGFFSCIMIHRKISENEDENGIEKNEKERSSSGT